MRIRLGILTGGGDVPPLNAAISAAREEADSKGIELIGILKGWEGALEGRFVDLSSVPINPATGGTVLKSSRLDIRKIADARSRILENFRRNEIGGLVTVGGEDTLSCSFLFPSFPQVLISKTIDNDVGQWKGEAGDFLPDQVMNYFTLGFPTAAEKIISYASLGEGLRTTAYSHERIIVLESMGMHSGWLALSSALGSPDFIIIPEFPLKYDLFLERVAERYEEKGHLMIVVAEGARYENLGYLRAQKDEIEGFGHPRFGGAAQALSGRLKKDLAKNLNSRNVNAVNPSYLYRSGAPNDLDRSWAGELGKRAVQVLCEGITQPVFLALQKKESGFLVQEFPLSEFASMNDLHRFVDPRLYDPDKFGATELAERYFLEFLKKIPFDKSYGIWR